MVLLLPWRSLFLNIISKHCVKMTFFTLIFKVMDGQSVLHRFFSMNIVIMCLFCTVLFCTETILFTVLHALLLQHHRRSKVMVPNAREYIFFKSMNNCKYVSITISETFAFLHFFYNCVTFKS